MKLRIALVAAMATSALFAGAGPASATCRPEKPSTCEVEDPELQCIYYVNLPSGHSFTFNLCDPPIRP